MNELLRGEAPTKVLLFCKATQSGGGTAEKSVRSRRACGGQRLPGSPDGALGALGRWNQLFNWGRVARVNREDQVGAPKRMAPLTRLRLLTRGQPNVPKECAASDNCGAMGVESGASQWHTEGQRALIIVEAGAKQCRLKGVVSAGSRDTLES